MVFRFSIWLEKEWRKKLNKTAQNEVALTNPYGKTTRYLGIMQDFLFWIGMYNVLGALLLMLLNSQKISDSILRKYTEIINEPYSHGPFGRMWLWWAATSNLFLGMVMVLSLRSSLLAQKEVIILVLMTYILMYFVMVFGGKKPKYGRGIYVTHILWLAQITWGLSIFIL